MAQAFFEINQLSKTYYPDTTHAHVALEKVSLSLPKGTFTMIMGSNAAGKSTLFHCISGRTDPSSGALYLDGQDITETSETSRAKWMARVSQDPADSVFPSLTVLENFAIAHARCTGGSWQLAKKTIDQSLIKARLSALGLGIERRLHERLSFFSGGQKQAIALLMATLHTPKLLLLDEHTAALDPKTSEQILQLTNQIVQEQGVTTLMITHNIHHALRYGNRLIVLERGRIVFSAVGDEKSALVPEDILAKIDHVVEWETDA